MSLRLIRPGMRSANLSGKRHPITGKMLTPIGYLKDGTAVWPIMGGAEPQDDPDADPDDPSEENEDSDEDDEDDDHLEDKKSGKKNKKDEDDDDEEDSRLARASRQAKRYRLELREEQRKNADMAARLKALEDKDKKPEEINSRDLEAAQKEVIKLAERNSALIAQLAFFQNNTVQWMDPADAFALAEREGLFDDVVDEDGTVDTRELRRGLKDLARRKPHLVKKDDTSTKARGRKSTDDDEDEEDEDEEPRSRRSAASMNGKRKGTRETANRAALAKRFPVLGRNF